MTFYLALQSGGCCDCGDPEAWKQEAGCTFHPHVTPTPLPERSLPVELVETMTRTVDCVLNFILDTLDHSPEDTVPPTEESDIRKSAGDATDNGSYAVVIWNDEKHSYAELTAHLSDVTGCLEEEAANLAYTNDFEVCITF